MDQPIILYENLRTIVYTPFYLAIERGDWAAEGVEVEARLSPAPTETAEGLIAGRADISWGGPMRVMMHHDRDPDCPLVCFGQVVARDPFILVGRTANPDFRFADLVGPRIAVACEVPTPWMTFQDDLRRAGIDLSTLNRAPDAPMAENLEKLAAGEIDVVQVFEPYAARAVADGAHIWHRLSQRGDVSYTTFYTTRWFIETRRETCVALVRGISRALAAVYREPPEVIAATVANYFPDLPRDVLTAAIAGYVEARLWAETPALPPTAVVTLKAALLSGELISRDVPYDDIVDDTIWTEGQT